MASKRFISPAEFKEITGLSSATIARRLRDKSVPHSKLGGRVLIPVEFISSLVSEAQANLSSSSSSTEEQQ